MRKRAPDRIGPDAPNGPHARDSGGAGKLRALNVPTPLRVDVDARRRPVRVFLDHKPRRVEAIRESWRIDDEWWRRPVSRWYLSLVLEDGALITVYRDLTNGHWYLQGG